MNSQNILDFIKLRSRKSKIQILILNDVFLAMLAFFLTNFFLPFESLFSLAFLISLTIILLYYFLGIYSNKLKFLSNKWLLQLINIFLLFILLIYIFSFIFTLQITPLYFYLLLYLILVIFSRLIAQSVFYKSAVQLKNILIYGAGVSGNKLYNSLKSNSPEYNVIGFIDDDPNKKRERIDSIKIYSPNQISKLSKEFSCYGIFIAMPSISSQNKKEILMKLLNEDLVIKIVPSVKSLVEKTSNFSDMRDINIQDLVDRSPVSPIKSMLEENTKDKTILITGGAGSIGSELVNQILSQNPKKVVILDMNELNIHNLMLETKKTDKLVSILGSLLDKPLLDRIFKAHKFDIVFHAAAYKHVSIVEDNMFYSVMNNVYSTFFIGNFSTKYNVENFVLVSTDKAVKPSNYMGKSKLIAEMIINQLSKTSKTNFSIVRFGNVLNSSGSVLSIFDQQIKQGGPLTVTDKNVTRYFMSIPEAAQLIIQSSTITNQCRTFILEMGESYNIYDLAQRIIKINGFQLKSKDTDGVAIDIIGLKEGEKLHEELTFNEKDLEETEHPKIYATTEKYFEFDVFEWIKKLDELYQGNDLKGFKDKIDILIKKHEHIN
jgi:FlaA1/EpsC-like NDP-sugar epimerase